MKVYSTGQRLKQIMKAENLRQADILAKCKPFCEKYNVKLGRNDISQYINNNVEPKQDKLTVLAMGLNVDEVWLMGYDTDKEGNYYIFDGIGGDPKGKAGLIPLYRGKRELDRATLDTVEKVVKSINIGHNITVSDREYDLIFKYKQISQQWKTVVDKTIESGYEEYLKEIEMKATKKGRNYFLGNNDYNNDSEKDEIEEIPTTPLNE